MSNDNIQIKYFKDDGSIPNNKTLPLVIYKTALPGDDKLVTTCRNLFKQNGWGGIWVNNIYSYHHYHSTAHEVLGIVGGVGQVQFGGPSGEIITLETKDIVFIPAGIGHCRIESSRDFRVVGAYPGGQDWDMRTGEPGERPEVLHNIEIVPLPTKDAVYGPNGPLLDIWRYS